MRLRIHTIAEGAIAAEHNLELSGDMDLLTVKILLEDESQIPMDDQVLVSRGHVVEGSEQCLQDLGFRNNDSLVVYKRGARVLNHARYENEANRIRASPYEISQMKQDSPSVAEAILAGDIALFAALWRSLETASKVQEEERQDLYRRVRENPNDEEAKKAVEEMERMERVQENMMAAMEHHPEAFGQVHMLYINCEVNKVPVKAFVDSGAQMTIMSPSCAERCGISNLIDPRWSGMAEGVGTAKILGRVHMVDVNIGGNFLPCSFSVIENQSVDMLLGLDMLKRHQCCIDLRDGVLRVGTTNGVTPFLPESELPPSARLNRSAPSASAASENGNANASGQHQFDESTVDNLVKMGFSRDEAVGALTACGGNADLAASVLLGN